MELNLTHRFLKVLIFKSLHSKLTRLTPGFDSILHILAKLEGTFEGKHIESLLARSSVLNDNVSFSPMTEERETIKTAEFLSLLKTIRDRKRDYVSGDPVKPFKDENFVLVRRRFTEELDLSDLEINFSVIFNNCVFEKHIRLVGSKLHNMHFWGCKIETLDAYGVEVKHNLTLKSYDKKTFRAKGLVRLKDAKIGGTLSFDGGEFNARSFGLEGFKYASAVNRYAIDATNIEIGGSLVINDTRRDSEDGSERAADFVSRGHVSFRAARIGKTLTARGACFMAGSFIDKNLKENSDFRLVGQTWNYVFGQAIPDKQKLDGDYHEYLKDIPAGAYKSLFRRYTEAVISLDLYEARIGASAHFSYGTISIGTLRMGGCEIQGKLSFKGARLYEVEAVCPHKKAYRNAREMARSIVYYGGTSKLPWGALDAANLKVGGSLYLSALKVNSQLDKDNEFWAFGRVSFVGATINGRIIISGGLFFKSDDYAFRNPVKDEKATCRKPQNLDDEDPENNSAERMNPGRHPNHLVSEEKSPDEYVIRYTRALDFSLAVIRLDFLISNDALIVGQLALDSTEIRGRVSLTKTTIIAYFRDRNSVSALGCVIGGALALENHCAFAGCVDFKDSRVASTVTLQNSVFTLGRPNGGTLYGEEWIKMSEGTAHYRCSNFLEYFDVIKDGTRGAQNDRVQFKGNYQTNPFKKDLAAAIEAGLSYEEDWGKKRDRHWNPSFAVNFHRSEIQGSFHVSYHEEEKGNESYKYSAIIAGKLNLVDASVKGNLRLHTSSYSDIFTNDGDSELETDSRFDLSEIVNECQRKYEVCISSTNLRGARVGSFNLSKNLIDDDLLRIDGFSYQRLVGDVFKSPAYVKKLLLSVQDRGSQDVSNAKRMLSYYQNLGSSDFVSKLDQVNSLIQHTKLKIEEREKEASSLILLICLLVVSFYCIAFYSLQWEPLAALFLVPILSLTLLLFVWIGEIERGEEDNKLRLKWRRCLNGNQALLYYSKSFVGHGNHFRLRPTLWLTTIITFLFAYICWSQEAIVIRDIQNALIVSFELCLPPVGIGRENDGHMMTENILTLGNWKSSVLRIAIGVGKMSGWAMLSLMVAGYIKGLRGR